MESLETLHKDSHQGNLIPVVRELPADLETPVSVFLKLAKTAPSFLLESVERGEQLGRYSFIGTKPYLQVQTSGDEGVVHNSLGTKRIALAKAGKGPDPLHLVQSLLSRYGVAQAPGLPHFCGGAVGYLGYDVVRFFEDLPGCPDDELHLPDSAFLFSDTQVVFDHVQHKMKVVSNVAADSAGTEEKAAEKIQAIADAVRSDLLPEPRTSFPVGQQANLPLESNFSAARFCEAVGAAKEYILSGDAFQIVLSQRLRRRTAAEPFSIYRALRMLNPSPYMFYLDFGHFQMIGSSPEMLVKLEGGLAETRPIAGTRPRGSSHEEDEATIVRLLADPKERAEHNMLVDLGRNDIGRVARHGTVKVPLYMGIEKYSHVIHIVSSVKGELSQGHSAFDLLRACFPAGTVSGAPKVRAMEIIAELEGTKRGPYAGAVGYFGFGGNMDTCITIRTIVMVGDTVYLQGGAGIVADSDPMREYQETLSKIQVLDDAVCLAERWKSEGRGRG